MQRFQKPSKKVLAAGALVLGAVQSQAAVAYDPVLGFSGAIDMTSYNTAIPLVITVIGIVIATTLGIRALKGAKSS